MKKHLFISAAICAVLAMGLTACSEPQQEPASEMSETAFDAQASWDEFEDLVRLFYAYLERDDFDVEAQLKHSKKLAVKATSDADFRKILHQTAYTFTDPHFIVGPFTDDDYNIIPTSSDLVAAWNGKDLIVRDVRIGSAADKAGIRPGWRVSSIDGQTPETATLLPFGDVLETPTAKQRDYGATLAVNGLRKGSRELVFQTPAGEAAFTLATPRGYAFEVSERPLLKTMRHGSVGHIRIENKLGNNDLIQAFDKAVEDMSDTSALILDMRNTPSGGNTEVGRSIIGHFVTQTESYQIHEIPSLEREFSVPRRFIEQVKPRKPYYGKPVVVLGGHWTGSMGEGIVIGMDAATDAHIITSNMGDLLGGLSNYNLSSSSARIDLGSETLFHVNGTPREDFEGDVMLIGADRNENGEDAALKAALHYLGAVPN